MKCESLIYHLYKTKVLLANITIWVTLVYNSRNSTLISRPAYMQVGVVKKMPENLLPLHKSGTDMIITIYLFSLSRMVGWNHWSVVKWLSFGAVRVSLRVQIDLMGKNNIQPSKSIAALGMCKSIFSAWVVIHNIFVGRQTTATLWQKQSYRFHRHSHRR